MYSTGVARCYPIHKERRRLSSSSSSRFSCWVSLVAEFYCVRCWLEVGWKCLCTFSTLDTHNTFLTEKKEKKIKLTLNCRENTEKKINCCPAWTSASELFVNEKKFILPNLSSVRIEALSVYGFVRLWFLVFRVKFIQIFKLTKSVMWLCKCSLNSLSF